MKNRLYDACLLAALVLIVAIGFLAAIPIRLFDWLCPEESEG